MVPNSSNSHDFGIQYPLLFGPASDGFITFVYMCHAVFLFLFLFSFLFFIYDKNDRTLVQW